MYKLPVSVIITCKDLHQYLEESYKSLENQTMRPTEIIIIHDGCQPAPVFKGTTTVFRDINRGVSFSRNEGANIATSDTLLFLDADDTLDEYFIEAMVKTKEKTRADIVYPNVLLWSNWHKDIKMKNAWHESPNKITWKNMLDFNQIVVSCFIPKKLYFEVGGMANLPILEDYDFFLKCLKQGATFAKSPASVLRYRQREEGRNRKSHELKNEFTYTIRDKYASTRTKFHPQIIQLLRNVPGAGGATIGTECE